MTAPPPLLSGAIALQSEIPLMDKPTASLDPVSTSRVEGLLDRLKRHYTILVITHDLQQASRIADRVAFFNVERRQGQRVGQLVEYAPATVIFSSPAQSVTRGCAYGQQMLHDLLL